LIIFDDATLKGLRRSLPIGNPSQPFQSCDYIKNVPYPQGFKPNPGLKFANAFGVLSTTHNLQFWPIANDAETLQSPVSYGLMSR